MPDDHVPSNPQTEKEACWAELRTALHQLESSMTEFQDAVTGLDSAFATVESAANQGSEPTPNPANDTVTANEPVAGD